MHIYALKWCSLIHFQEIPASQPQSRATDTITIRYDFRGFGLIVIVFGLDSSQTYLTRLINRLFLCQLA